MKIGKQERKHTCFNQQHNSQNQEFQNLELGVLRGGKEERRKNTPSFPGLHQFLHENVKRVRRGVKTCDKKSVQFSSVQSLNRVQLFAAPWAAACQASPSITSSQSLLKLMSIESVMPSSHLILCHTLLLLPSMFPSIRVFSNESVLCIRRSKYWSFSLNISSSKHTQD